MVNKTKRGIDEAERKYILSVNKNTYGIIGYDLTNIKDDILTEIVCESDWYSNLICNQSIGNIQAFDDPMSGNYLYFGYIFFETDEEYRDVMYSISLDEIASKIGEIKTVLKEKFNLDVATEPKIIVFNEYT